MFNRRREVSKRSSRSNKALARKDAKAQIRQAVAAFKAEMLEGRVMLSTGTPVHDITQHTDFATIQAAVNAASTMAGDVITVDPGTYAGATISKPLTLEGNEAGVDATTGRPGADETIIDGSGGAFGVTANNVTIDGFVLKGQTNGNAGPGFGFAIDLSPGFTGSHIQNNIIQDDIAGISLANTGASQTTIQHNLIQNNNNAGSGSGTGIYTDQFNGGGTVSNVLIDSNRFVGNDEAGLGFSSTDAAHPTTNITISNNVFDGNAGALYAFNLTSSSITGNTIENSTESDAADLQLLEGVKNLSITDNVLENGAGGALEVSNIGTGSPNATNITFTENAVMGYSVPSDTFLLDPGAYTGTLDASLNYWGTSTPATVAGEITGAVDFTPLLNNNESVANQSIVGFQADLSSLTVDSLGSQVGAVGRIQEGVNDVAIGGQVNVAGGTYTESPLVNKSVTLDGAGEGVSIIDLLPSASASTYLGSIEVESPAATVTIEGFTIVGNDAVAHGTANSDIYVALGSAGVSSVTIDNNQIESGQIGAGATGDDGMGIITESNSTTLSNVLGTLTVSGNAFTPKDASGSWRAFYINPGTTNFNFTSNTITGNYGHRALTEANNGLIEGNTVTGAGSAGSRSSGIGAYDEYVPTTLGTTSFIGNTLSNLGIGISLLSVDNSTVQNNVFTNDDTAVSLDTSFTAGSDPTTDSITENDFDATNTTSVSNDSGVTLNASENWWGSSNPSTVAATIVGTANVDFTPLINSGTDTDLVTAGFQPDLSSLTVHTLGTQVGATGRIQEGINDITVGGTVDIVAGTYTGDVNTNSQHATLAVDPGQVTINGNLTLNAHDTLDINIQGTGPTQFDNFVVNGDVSLGGANLSVTPTALGSFQIISNDATDPVASEFAQGTSGISNGVQVAINYAGGSGNDVVVTIAQPTTVWVDDNWAITNDVAPTGLSAGDTVTLNTGDKSDSALDAGGEIFGYNAFSTISAAVSAVASGGTVHVISGTYNEQVTLTNPVTLLGANAGIHPVVGANTTDTVGTRGAESILSHDGLSAITPSAANITIDGFDFTGAGSRIIDATSGNIPNLHITNNIFAETGSAGSTGIIQLVATDVTHLTIDYNSFVDRVAGSSSDLYAGVGDFDNLRIANNYFNSETGSVFWAAQPPTGAVVTNNEFDGTINGVSGVGTPLMNIGTGGNIAIDDNYFHDLQYTAFQVGIVGGEVVGNTFGPTTPLAGSFGDAFQLWGGEFGTSVSTNVNIANNIIHFNDSASLPTRGIRLRAQDGGSMAPGIDGTTIHVHDNTFINGGAMAAGNGANAITFQGDQTKPVDASGNYWGTTNAATISALMLGPVDFTPYLASGTDTDSGAVGFQGDFSTLDVTSLGSQDSDTGRIQEAVNLIADGSLTGAARIINVGAGTYNELVQVDEPVKLLGAQAGIDARTRTAVPESIVSNSDGDFQVLADNVTIDGFTIEGVTTDSNADPASLGVGIWMNPGFIDNHDGTQIFNNIIQDNIAGIELDSDGTYQTIVQHNLLQDNDEPGSGSGNGIQVSFGLTNALIDNNTFTNNPNSAMVVEAPSSDVTFSNNVSDSGVALLDTTTFQFSDNTITDATGAGLFIGGGDSSIAISGSTISGSHDTGSHGPYDGIDIEPYSSSSNSDITITNVLLSGNDDGIHVGTGGLESAGDLTVHDSSIAGNLTAGIDNEIAISVNATNNWWGDANGPTTPLNTFAHGSDTTGDVVTGPATVVPWLTDGTNTVSPPTPGFFPNAQIYTTSPTAPAPTVDPATNSGSINGFTNNPQPIYFDNAMASAGTVGSNLSVQFFQGNAPGTSLGFGTYNSVAGQWQLQSPSLTDGTYTIYAQVTDHAGQATISGPLTVHIDLATPAPTISQPVMSPTFMAANNTESNTPTFSGTLTVGDGAQTPTVAIYDNTSTLLGMAAVSGGPLNWTYSFTIQGTTPLADGLHSITAQVTDEANNVNTSTALSMTVLPPDTTVEHLPAAVPTKTFAVTVDQLSGVPTAAISDDIYVSTNGGPFVFWTNVPSTSPTAMFTGTSNTNYAFRSISRDTSGSTETKTDLPIEAGTYVQDFDPPVTSVSNTVSVSGTGLFTIPYSGVDVGGSSIAFYNVYVVIDAGTMSQSIQLITKAPGSTTQTTFQALTGTHTYGFWTDGIDSSPLANTEADPTVLGVLTPDFTTSYTLSAGSPISVTNFSVQQGLAERSFIRYIDVTFNQPVNLATSTITLEHDNLSGTSGVNVDLTGLVSVDPANPDVLHIDFGVKGIGSTGTGGVANSNVVNTFDGYYRLKLTTINGNAFNGEKDFYRILGDTNGDRTANSTDLNAVAAGQGKSSTLFPNLDVDGSGGVINTTDLSLTSAAKTRGETLLSTLTLS